MRWWELYRHLGRDEIEAFIIRRLRESCDSPALAVDPRHLTDNEDPPDFMFVLSGGAAPTRLGVEVTEYSQGSTAAERLANRQFDGGAIRFARHVTTRMDQLNFWSEAAHAQCAFHRRDHRLIPERRNHVERFVDALTEAAGAWRAGGREELHRNDLRVYPPLQEHLRHVRFWDRSHNPLEISDFIPGPVTVGTVHVNGDNLWTAIEPKLEGARGGKLRHHLREYWLVIGAVGMVASTALWHNDTSVVSARMDLTSDAERVTSIDDSGIDRILVLDTIGGWARQIYPRATADDWDQRFGRKRD